MYIIIYQIRMDVTTKKEKNFFSTTIDVFSTISNIDFLTIIVFSFVYLIVFRHHFNRFCRFLWKLTSQKKCNLSISILNSLLISFNVQRSGSAARNFNFINCICINIILSFVRGIDLSYNWHFGNNFWVNTMLFCQFPSWIILW